MMVKETATAVAVKTTANADVTVGSDAVYRTLIYWLNADGRRSAERQNEPQYSDQAPATPAARPPTPNAAAIAAAGRRCNEGSGPPEPTRCAGSGNDKLTYCFNGTKPRLLLLVPWLFMVDLPKGDAATDRLTSGWCFKQR